MTEQQETFSNFNEVENVTLRVYNRVVTMNNIAEDFGHEKLAEYIEQFNQGERKQMFVMQSFIKKVGPEAALKHVQGTLENPEEPVYVN